MTNIIEELRKIERAADIPPRGHASLAGRAADEIERLRKALEAAREYLESDVADGFRPAERLTAEIDQVLAVVGGSGQ